MNDQLMVAGVSALAAWIWWVDRRVSAHEEIIRKLDRFMDILLEDRLNRS